MDALIRTAAEPSILGMANHLLYVGQKHEGSSTSGRSAMGRSEPPWTR
jgi:hypothetical protein